MTQNLDAAMKNLVSPEARSRISAIALATPERAEMIKQTIVQLHSQGKLNTIMNDEKVTSILTNLLTDPTRVLKGDADYHFSVYSFF